ncbi:MAG: AAA family ATPase [Pseudothermotoga sp.]
MKIKPLSLEVENFLGIEKCKVEFKEGVFLILGQNGAGKSSLLEAIVFALYGTGVRYGRKSPQDYVRSSTSTCQVRFSFLRNGKKYEVFRRVRSSGTEALLLENDAIIATQRTHVDRELQRILDTTYESFISTFFLPQGRATYLLTAKRSEINDIVFDVLFPKKVLKSVQEKINEIVKNLQIEHEKMQAHLSDLRVRFEQISNVATLEKIEFCNTKLKELQEQLESTAEKLKLIEQQRVSWQRIKELEKGIEQLKNEKNKLIARAEEERKISLAKSLGKDHQILLAIREKVESSQKEQRRIEEQIKKLQDDIAKIKQELIDFERNRDEIQQHINKLNLERAELQKIDLQSEPLLNDLNQLKTLKSLLDREKINNQNNLSEVEKQISQKQNTLNDVKNTLRQLEKDYNQMKQTALIAMSQEIAQNLQDGDTCPVCGNVFRKTTIIQQHIDIQKYQELKKSIEEYQKQKEQLDLQLKTLYKVRDDVTEHLNQINRDLLSCLEKMNAIENDLQRMGYNNSVKEGIRKLSKEIEDLLNKKVQSEAKISQLREAKDQLSKRIEELKSNLQDICSELERRRTELMENENRFLEKLKEVGLTMKEFEIYNDKELPRQSSLEMLQKIELQMEKNYEEIVGLKESISLDYESCENEYRRLNGELEIVKRQRDEYIQQKAVLEHLIQELRNIEEQKRNLQEQFESVHRQYQIAELVKSTLSAKGFQSFVTDIVLDEITMRTNSILDTLTDGRFKIKVDETGFLIIDENTNRSADGLSGGEKTMVSLALAIAIAETATGQMEIFFIDEGFSALDEENKSRIANTLKQMEKLNKVIGFVTHDPQFAEYFDRKLMVEKGGVVRWI